MKYLILYMSHHGTTRKIVTQMAMHLGTENTTLVDLESENVPDLAGFDTVLIGGSIHVGTIQKKIREFCSLYEHLLLKKRVGLFICALEERNAAEHLQNSFPQKLLDHAVAKGFFGGELVWDKMNFFEKIFVRTIYGVNKNLSELDEEAILNFEKKIQE